MFAVTAERIDVDDPLSGLGLGERPEPVPPQGWTTVELRAAALNHHDLWTLKGVGIKAERLPIILGADAAGVDESGREVIVHAVIGDVAAGGGDETLDARRSLLSEVYDGTLAERICVPAGNLVPKPAGMSWAEAACLPTAWLTAYRMIFVRSGAVAGDTILVQGAGGGVATALITLAKAGGFRVWATSRDASKRERALQLGADAVETVGAATWDHSLKALKPGGRIVICGATSGANPPADLNRVFFLQLSIIGSTMGTLAELGSLVEVVTAHDLHPLVDSTFALRDARAAFERLASGEAFGKIVLTNG
jgi:NADPH:quinone reductase-like Zn-dependent oxidoreductase